MLQLRQNPKRKSVNKHGDVVADVSNDEVQVKEPDRRFEFYNVTIGYICDMFEQVLCDIIFMLFLLEVASHFQQSL